MVKAKQNLNKIHGGERIQEKLQTICLNQRCPISEREFLTVKPRGSTDSYALTPREMLPKCNYDPDTQEIAGVCKISKDG